MARPKGNKNNMGSPEKRTNCFRCHKTWSHWGGKKYGIDKRTVGIWVLKYSKIDMGL